MKMEDYVQRGAETIASPAEILKNVFGFNFWRGCQEVRRPALIVDKTQKSMLRRYSKP
jgi:hypothetical protein